MVMLNGSAPRAVERQEPRDIEVVEPTVACGVSGYELIVEQVDEVGDIVEIEIPVRVVIRWARDDARLWDHRLYLNASVEGAGDGAVGWVHLVDDAVGSSEVEHAIECDGGVDIGIHRIGSCVVHAAFELIEEVDGALLCAEERDPGEVHRVGVEGHRLHEGTACGEELEGVLPDVCTHGECGVPADKEPARVESDRGDVCICDERGVLNISSRGVDIIQATAGISDDEVLAEPRHCVCVGVDRESAVDEICSDVVGVEDAVGISEVEGAVVYSHRVDWSRADASEGNDAGVCIEGVDDALGPCEEDGVGAGALCKAGCGEDGDGSWGVHADAPVWEDAFVSTTCVVGSIFEGKQEKRPPLFGGDPGTHRVVGSEVGFGSADEQGEQFAARGHIEMTVDREHMIVNRGTSDIAAEGDLLLGIAHEQAFEHLASAFGELAYAWLLGCGEESADLFVDDHVQHGDERAFTAGEVSRSDALVEPECGASVGDAGWADRNDVIIDPAFSMDFVECVRSVPGFASPDLIAGEHEGLAGELGQVWVFGSAFDGYRLRVFSPADFRVMRDPTVAMGPEVSGVVGVRVSEMLDLGADDDLGIDDGSEFAEKLLTPSVNIGSQIATTPCDLVALVDISGGQLCEHGDDSVPRSGPIEKPEGACEVLSAEFRGVSISVRAREQGVGGVGVIPRDTPVGVHNIAEVFERSGFDMPVAERDIRFIAMSGVGSGAVFHAPIPAIGEVVVAREARRIEGVPVSAFGAEFGVSGAVVPVLGVLGDGLARGGAQRVREHHGARGVETRCTHGKVDEPVVFVVVEESRVPEELVVVPVGVVSGVVPFGDDGAEEHLVPVDCGGVFVLDICAGLGECIETGRGSDDGEPPRSVMIPVAELVDISLLIGIAPGLSGDGDIPVGVGIDLPPRGDLSHACGAEQGLGGIAGTSERGEQNPDQQRNDRDHDKQLDQGEAVSVGTLCIRTVHREVLSAESVDPFHDPLDLTPDSRIGTLIFGPASRDARSIAPKEAA